MSREDLAHQSDIAELEILEAVRGGAETLREVLAIVPHRETTRYAFFRALNERRLHMGADRKLSVIEGRG